MSGDERINPFRIEVAQRDIDDLARRLEMSRWPDELPDVARTSRG
jgi:epoxide hydrolase